MVISLEMLTQDEDKDSAAGAVRSRGWRRNYQDDRTRNEKGVCITGSSPDANCSIPLVRTPAVGARVRRKRQAGHWGQPLNY